LLEIDCDVRGSRIHCHIRTDAAIILFNIAKMVFFGNLPVVIFVFLVFVKIWR